MQETVIIAASALIVYMILVFLVASLLDDNSIVDIAYGIGFIIVSLLAYCLVSAQGPVETIVLMLVILWGGRLSWRILHRAKKRGTEDWRYALWRTGWMESGVWYFYLRSFLQIYMLQAAVIFIILLPVLYIMTMGAQTGPLVYAGIAVWIIGYYFEVRADWELKEFLDNKKNKGKIMTTGLWRYSRHPNYFGEATMWWGIYAIALAAPGGWWTILSPMTITYFVRFVSGVPLLENKYAGRPDWEEYKKRTNVFIPLPPKKTQPSSTN